MRLLDVLNDTLYLVADNKTDMSESNKKLIHVTKKSCMCLCAGLWVHGWVINDCSSFIPVFYFLQLCMTFTVNAFPPASDLCHTCVLLCAITG